MKRIVIAATMMATPAVAKDSVLSCFVPDTREHVVIIGSGGEVRLQWNGGRFEYGTARMMDDRFLLVEQFSSGGTFRMVYDSTSGAAYGGTVFYSGKENKTPFNCSWQ
jgi:hypothetical protein